MALKYWEELLTADTWKKKKAKKNAKTTTKKKSGIHKRVLLLAETLAALLTHGVSVSTHHCFPGL